MVFFALLLPGLALLLGGLTGCESRKEETTGPVAVPDKIITETPAPSPGKEAAPPLLSTPFEPVLVEIASGALPEWRKQSRYRPTLVLLSSEPLLQPIPTQLEEEVRSLVTTGTRADIRDRGPFRAATALLPGQTLRAALQAGFFSRVVWVIPRQNEEDFIDAEQLRSSLITRGAIDEADAKTIEPTKKGFKATFLGTPFHVTHQANLPEVSGPVVLHIDLTFFSDLYKGEIKTPLYGLLHENLSRLRDTGWPGLAVTISLNNLIDVIPLEKRFLGPTLVRVFREPELLDRKAPKNWKLREDALYLDNFFQPEKIANLYLEMEKNDPGDPSIQYGLYQAALGAKALAPAMKHLSRAVELDPAYGKEYLDLAMEAERGGDYHGAVSLLAQAADAMPDNPLIKLRLAEDRLKAGDTQKSLELYQELQGLNWSPVYSSRVPVMVARNIEKLQKVPR